jgi:large subunit ribosomal protein L23
MFNSKADLRPHQLIIAPHVTEKGTHLSSRYNCYIFEVSNSATKEQVKNAVEESWNVRVLAVRTQAVASKPRRHKAKMGYRARPKKALVTLHPDDRIAFY